MKKPVVADITQSFYDSMASQYDKFYQDWQSTTREEAAFLRGIFERSGFDASARILDCACGIGTQAIGLAALGYDVTGSDISVGELKEAEKRAAESGVSRRRRRASSSRRVRMASSTLFPVIWRKRSVTSVREYRQWRTTSDSVAPEQALASM